MPTPRARPQARGPSGPVQRKGVLRHRIDNDYANLDPHVSAHLSAQSVGMLAYSRLLRFARGPGHDNLAATVAPELTRDTGEYVDGALVRFTLRSDVVYPDVAPVHGRRLTSTDVRLSFERARAGRGAPGLSIISGVQTPDERTVVVRLKRPTVTLPAVLASVHGLFVMPYEADASFDPSQTPIGSGPWMLDRLDIGVQARWRPNPRYFMLGADGYSVPYVEMLEDKVIPEDATARAQFAAGELEIAEMSPPDLLAVEGQAANAQIAAFPAQGFSFLAFSGRPGEPFRDVRVRRAFAMALDQRTLSNVTYGTDRLEQAGFPVLRQLPASPLPVGMRFWEDPATRPWGNNYEYRPDEARRLLTAAGWDFTRTLNWNVVEARNARAYSDSAQAVVQLLQQVGVATHTVAHDPAAWASVYQDGNFSGIAYVQAPRYAEPHDYFSRIVHSLGGFNPSRVRDPVLDALIEREHTIFDAADRAAMARAIIDRVNEEMYLPPLSIGTMMQYNVAQPWVGNALEYYATEPGAAYAEVFPYLWRTH